MDNNYNFNQMVKNTGKNNNDNDTKTEIKENKIKKILTNKTFLLILSILTFIFTLILVTKTFYLRNIVDHYEEFVTEITKKDSTESIAYIEEKDLKTNLKGSQIAEYVNCLNSNIDINNLPDNIKNIIQEINNFYNQSNNYFSFKYKDLYTGFTISYNENQNIFSASSIKAPKDIYIYEMASLNKINLEEELTYTTNYYNTGSGILKTKEFNEKYTTRKLLKLSTVDSDNAAHNMLMDRYGRQNMLEFWKQKGTNAIFTQHNNWGLTNAHDATIYMEELYNFYLNNEEYGNELMTNFLNAYPKFIKGKNNYLVANKSGWSGTAIHDMSIVFAENPYVVVALSNTGESDYINYFNNANELAYKLHTEYWNHKMDTCNNIINNQ